MSLFHRLEAAAPWLYGTLAAIVLAGAVGTNRAAAAGATTSESARAVRTLGRADAPATILEFTDLQCPYCAQFALETLPLLKQRYVDKGLLRIVSYDLPLNLHAYALPAAVAARCAGEQGHFWDYRDALFRGQAHLATAPYDQLARNFGMDVAAFLRLPRRSAAGIPGDGRRQESGVERHLFDPDVRDRPPRERGIRRRNPGRRAADRGVRGAIGEVTAADSAASPPLTRRRARGAAASARVRERTRRSTAMPSNSQRTGPS